MTFFSYNMEESLSTAKQGTKDITEYLASLSHVVGVVNVEDIYRYRTMDIDFIVVSDFGQLKLSTIELKVDKWDKSGNYYFEYMSNMNKKSKGCFLISEAEWLYYYFLNTKSLHIMPFKQIREWFLKNKHRFANNIKYSNTSDAYGEKMYTSYGYAVPIKIVLDEFKNVKIINISKENSNGR